MITTGNVEIDLTIISDSKNLEGHMLLYWLRLLRDSGALILRID